MSPFQTFDWKNNLYGLELIQDLFDQFGLISMFTILKQHLLTRVANTYASERQEGCQRFW